MSLCRRHQDRWDLLKNKIILTYALERLIVTVGEWSEMRYLLFDVYKCIMYNIKEKKKILQFQSQYTMEDTTLYVEQVLHVQWKALNFR